MKINIPLTSLQFKIGFFSMLLTLSILGMMSENTVFIRLGFLCLCGFLVLVIWELIKYDKYPEIKFKFSEGKEGKIED